MATFAKDRVLTKFAFCIPCSRRHSCKQFEGVFDGFYATDSVFSIGHLTGQNQILLIRDRHRSTLAPIPRVVIPTGPEEAFKFMLPAADSRGEGILIDRPSSFQVLADGHFSLVRPDSDQFGQRAVAIDTTIGLSESHEDVERKRGSLAVWTSSAAVRPD